MTTYTLDARTQWADTGINIKANQDLFISASGRVGPWAGANIGPDGSPTVKWAGSIVTYAYFCELVGEIGSDLPFGIGSGYGTVPAAAGRLHLSVNDGVNFGDNNGQLTVEITQGAAAIDKLIAHLLLRYGVTVYKNGLNSSDPDYIHHHQAWTFQELSNVLLGLQYTTRGLFALKYPTQDQNQVLDDQMQSLFRNVMGPIEIRRVKDGYTFAGSPCNGAADKACTDVANQFIAFYGNVNVTQYTLAHELGHWFNNRSAMGGGTSLYNRMQSATVNDSINQLVFGQQVDDWVRGKRGWGSGPASTYDDFGVLIPPLIITDFQQDSFTVLDSNFPTGDPKRVREIDEATADMFLNCMYAVATSRERGFLNISWLGPNCQTTPGCPDSSNPGDARYNWVQTQMSSIFTEHPTWV